MVDVKLRSSEVTLIKNYCSRVSDNDLLVLATALPQSVVGDRASACEILQQDKEMDRWLSHASGADDWFFKADSIGEFAVIEMKERAKKLEG